MTHSLADSLKHAVATVPQIVHDTVQVVVRDTVVVRVAEPAAARGRMIDMASGVATIVAGVATVVAACVAVWGIRAWRHQLKGATEYRFAIRLYRAVLRLRDRIRSAREPLNHLVPAYKGEDDTFTPQLVDRERDEYWNWFREVIKSALALNDLRPEAHMHWGSEATNHIAAMDEQARKLRGHVRAYFDGQVHMLQGERRWREVVESSRNVVYNMNLTGTGKDDYGDALDAVVAAAEAFLKRRIDLTK